HPQIVHDIHQQGANGSRLFLPPYLPPVEPNVPKELIEGFTELGNFMANDLRGKGFTGITTASTYDAWTPARAYSHYHGGVRILSETASARLATPVNIKYEDLRSGLGYDVRKETANFSPVWKGGEWHLRDITNYMTTAAFSLLKHASDNRETWLKRFYAVGKEAVRPRKQGEIYAFIIPNQKNDGFVNGALYRAGVETDSADAFTLDGVKYPSDTEIVKMAQPYAMFAKAILEKQTYPNLKDEKGNPIPPYDVTAHTLSLLTGIEVVPIYKPFTFPKPVGGSGRGVGDGCGSNKTITRWLYRSHVPSMDEGWTRWVLEEYGYQIPNQDECESIYKSTSDSEIQNAEKLSVAKVIMFADQSPNQILNGFPKGAMPDEYTGGIGADGVANLKKFVEAGGTLVFFNRASNFAIEQFDLPVKDVTRGLARKDFFIPGSILRTELDTINAIAKGMPKDSIAWFENSPAFEITDNINAKIIAKYPADVKNILLSGYALGAERIAGKAALVEIKMGKGKIILFGFRPQYRGQSLATFPLLFNAISN
ncbi:MAG TPA: hypothetical protein VNI60_10190, partial [Pyrinomonadaceae bacterium]|nr:hypothetical protein [Pyrinomonadaceae bacterium]